MQYMRNDAFLIYIQKIVKRKKAKGVDFLEVYGIMFIKKNIFYKSI